MDEPPGDLGAADQEPSDDPQPRVAVITVTYNRAHLLAKAIDSVLSQEYTNLRLVVVDDGSTDDTGVLLRKYQADHRVEVVRHDTNLGVIAARNTGLACLTEEDVYFCYLDSDDTLLPGAIQTMVKAFDEHGDRYSMIWAASQDAATGRSDGWHSLDSPEVTFDDQLAGRFRGDFKELVRRDLLGSLRYDARAGGGEGILWAQILRKKPALMIPEVVQLTDRSGADRVSHARYDRNSAESLMWSRLSELRVIGTDLRRAYPHRYAVLLRKVAQAAAMAGDRRRARLASRWALRLDRSPRTAVVACAALAPSWVVRRWAHAVQLIRSRRGRAGRDL
jgi:glycosyltransferase involved in cell wall biosynthesis